MHRILQISDLHLSSSADAELLGVQTWPAFSRQREHILATEDEFDLIVITGDIAHDEELQTYELFRDQLPEHWLNRLRIVPGNRDDRHSMRSVFPQAMHPATDAAPLRFEESIGGVLFVGLDSHVPGEIPGRLESTEIDWLTETLNAAADTPVCVFMHHPPVPVGTSWMDRIGLQNPHDFLNAIGSVGNVQMVICGHVHHHHVGTIGEISFETTPAVSAQFKPGTEELVVDEIEAGYRVIDVEHGTIKSQIRRLS